MKSENGETERAEERTEEWHREEATFVVKVHFRQNATWQGTISWTDQKKTQHFRSTLELIRLMDEALGQQALGALSSSWEPQEEG